MNSSKAGLLRLVRSRKALVSVIVVAVLVLTSTAAAVGMSDLKSTAKVPKAHLTIANVTHDPDEAYVDQLVTWSVVVVLDKPNTAGKTFFILWTWDDSTGASTYVTPNETDTVFVDVQMHAWEAPGLYDVVVSVLDWSGSKLHKVASVSETIPFLVVPEEPNTPPVAIFSISPSEGTTDTLFKFNASASYDLDDIPESLEVRWDWNNDGFWDTNYSTAKLAWHRFSVPGWQVVNMEVKDSGGLTNESRRGVNVLSSSVLTPHGPIYINGDAEFVAENGVVGGTGAPDDPYVIGGWIIEAYSGNAITVLNALSCFVIRDVELIGDVNTSSSGIRIEQDGCALIERAQISGFYYGIRALSLGTLTIRSCDVQWNVNGIAASTVHSFDAESNIVSYNCIGEGNGMGIDVSYGAEVLVMNNTMEWNRNSALRLYQCGLATVIHNHAEGLFLIILTKVGMSWNNIGSGGIHLWGCEDSEVSLNTIGVAGNNQYLFGIEFTTCANLTIQHNTIASFYYGLGTHYAADPPTYSERVLVLGNTISGAQGSGMRIYYISGLEIADNRISGCSLGLDVTATASYVKVYHNDFVGNYRQASESALCVGNSWDDGYPSGGNYWSDYLGVDEYSGADQTEPGSDGIGDTPYVLSSGNQDRYPFMEPFTPAPSEYLPHDPILIVGDADFTSENGVTSGSGTASDPFVIAGWDIDASTAIGVDIRSTTAYYTLRDMRIHSGTSAGPYYFEGIRIESASNGRVERIETYGNSMDLSIRYSSNMVIADNEFTNEFSGVVSLLSCNFIEIYNNTLNTHAIGIAVQYTSNVYAVTNTFSSGGFTFYGSTASHFNTHYISADNTVAGRPIIFIAYGHDIYLDGVMAAQVIVASAESVILSNLDISNVSQGVVLAYVSHAVIGNCTFTSNLYSCVKLYYCDNVTLVGNLISDCLYYALETISSSYVTVVDNFVAGNSYGIVMRYRSDFAVIERNTAYNNFAAVLLYQASGGVRVLENDLSYNDIGIFMSGSTGSQVAGNMIAMNALQGILMESGSTSNTFYHNNMMANAVQVAEEYAGANTWDIGYPSGGNYWSDYLGADEYSGVDQADPGSDGIGDTPYVLTSGSQDDYPLMWPYGSELPVPTTPVATYSRTAITNGVRINILSITDANVSWSDVRVYLTDGYNSTVWSPVATDLDGGTVAVANYSTRMLGTLSVCCWVADLAGNGLINGADYIALFTYGGAITFRPGVVYTFVLVYEPTGEWIGTGTSFTG